MNRPDAAQFAKWSYYLSFATSGIMLLGLLLGFARTPLAGVIWLSFVTSAVGAFMAWAAKNEFKTKPPSDDVMMMAKRGWRVNIVGFGIMIAFLVVLLIFQLIFARGALVPTVDPTATPGVLMIWLRL